jgi:hypothetical protein
MDAKSFARPASDEVVAKLTALQPANPFVTPQYFEARRQMGYKPWVLDCTRGDANFELGCGAFLRAGRIRRILEIASLPPLDAKNRFWQSLLSFCRAHRVTDLYLDSYGAPSSATIPDLCAHWIRRSRCEFVLALEGELRSRLSSNHRRNLKKAEKAHLQLTCAKGTDALAIHRGLQGQSLSRRRTRGEDTGVTSHASDDSAFLLSGAGDIFQATCHGIVLSSVLVLRTRNSGYYHSAGTSPEGMAHGASHFLISRVAHHLGNDGASTFNLGGADPNSTLARFKEGFGTRKVPLESAQGFVGPQWLRLALRLRDLFQSVQSIPS